MELINTLQHAIAWQEVLVTSFRLGLILILTLVALRLARTMLGRLEQSLEKRKAADDLGSESSKRTDTLTRLLRQAIMIFIWLVAILVILGEFEIDIGPLLASAGIAGLAIGFGAQNLVRDVISGFFMILEDQIRVGDVAIVNGTGGLVEKINFRTIVLRDLAGVVHVFPNGTVNTLSNMTHQWSAYVLDIGVAYKEDIDRVIETMREVGAEMRADETFGPLMLEDLEIFGVDSFGDSAVIVKGRLKTKPIQQWAVGREYRKRLKQAFDRKNIEIPFPHRSLYFGEASKPMILELLRSEQEAEAKKVPGKE